ncbi:MAG: glutathione S-transferase family protein [Alphaproteobacteria bacterium]|nr:glutathione S-transferase family protein [Alphaproteobacteria bacterium]
MSARASSSPGGNTWETQIAADGEFVRKPTSFHGQIKQDGTTSFLPEPGRYHLYVSLACPWAHRTLIFRQLKGLQSDITVDVVHYHMGENGWEFHATADGATPDTINARNRLYEVYLEADPSYTGRVTVPVLWDKQQNTIVNNESSEIIRMLNNAFDSVGAEQGDYYPAQLREEIDSVNKTVYSAVNNGVYKAGFATSQQAYEDAFAALFDMLDMLEAKLSKHRYLVGNTLSEADWRLFTTLVRFDAVYVGHFKCNLKRLVDYPNLWAWTRELYQIPGIAETVNRAHIKDHYYRSHRTINPAGIVPAGPEIDFTKPHGRDRLTLAA